MGLARRHFFSPRPKAADFIELNRWLAYQCVAWAMRSPHPSIAGRTVWEVFQEEREHLIKVPRPFDGYSEESASVSGFSLVPFDRNRYSVRCDQVGNTVQVKAYAERVVLVSEGQVVGEHERRFGRGQTFFNPWHYLPALERKPGALRNGAPFVDWQLPLPLQEVRDRLRRFADWDRQFVAILSAVPTHGLQAVSEACRQALSQKTVSQEVILNILNRARDQRDCPPLESLCGRLRLSHEPVADCARYDLLRGQARHDA